VGADLVDGYGWLSHPVDVDDGSSVIAWVRAALERDAGFPPDVALPAANLGCRTMGHVCIYKAAEVIAVAWGTTRLPAGAAWWRGPGAWLMERIQIPPDRAFDWVDEAYCAIGESLAEPAPDAYDPNWPPHKVFWAVDVPDGVRVGGTFVVGNGMGDRYRMKVIQRDGRIGVAGLGGASAAGPGRRRARGGESAVARAHSRLLEAAPGLEPIQMSWSAVKERSYPDRAWSR
jgi:hypothetical protein